MNEDCKGSLKKNVTFVLLGSDPPLFSGKCKHFKHVFEKCNEDRSFDPPRKYNKCYFF